MKRRPAFLATLACATLLSGCMVGPRYKRPAVAPPAAYRGATAPDIDANAAAPPLGAQKWNTVFTDPVLQALISEALEHNYDVKIAADRVLEQQAQAGVTRASQFPTLNVGGNYAAIGLPSGLLSGNNGNTTNNGGAGNNNGQSPQTAYYAGGFNASAAWNLDFWGLYRRQTEAARAQLRATQWAQQTTYSTLVENVASSYYQLRALDAELATSHEAVITRQQSLDLTRRLDNGGNSTLADVRQAEDLLYTAKAQVPDLKRQIDQQENGLSLLLGRSPGPIARGGPIETAPHPMQVPVGLPSDLLERRPDIRRAEELLVQANANIGAARAQFFPQFSLSATAGISSSQLKGLVEQKNAFYYALGTATQPIFDGGKIRNNYRLSKAQEKEILDTYQQTIAGALRDVSNALTAYGNNREYREQQEHLVASSADAVRLAKMRYEAGYTSYLEVLTNDANLLSARLTLETAEQQEALSLVQLYNALGGGW